MELVLGIILLTAAIFLIVAVLIQQGKSKGLSGAVAGSAETFYGKTKGKSRDKILSKLTTVVGTIFIVAVLVVYVIQDIPDYKSNETFDKAASNYAEKKDTEAPAETTEAPKSTNEQSSTEAPSATEAN